MKRIIIIFFVACVTLIVAQDVVPVFHWYNMNLDPNKEISPINNLMFKEVSNIPTETDSVNIKLRLANKFKSGLCDTIKADYGFTVKNAIMVFSGGADGKTHKVWPKQSIAKTGEIQLPIKMLFSKNEDFKSIWNYDPKKDSVYIFRFDFSWTDYKLRQYALNNNLSELLKNAKKGSYSKQKGCIPIYALSVKDTLRYEDSPVLASQYGVKPGQAVVYGALFFKDGLNGMSQCNNFISYFEVITLPKKEPEPDFTIIQPPVVPKVTPKIVYVVKPKPEPIKVIETPKPKSEPVKVEPIQSKDYGYTYVAGTWLKEGLGTHPYADSFSVTRYDVPNKQDQNTYDWCGFYSYQSQNLIGEVKIQSIDASEAFMLGIFLEIKKSIDAPYYAQIGASVNGRQYTHYDTVVDSVHITSTQKPFTLEYQENWLYYPMLNFRAGYEKDENYLKGYASISPITEYGKSIAWMIGIDSQYNNKFYYLGNVSYREYGKQKLPDLTKPFETKTNAELRLGSKTRDSEKPLKNLFVLGKYARDTTNKSVVSKSEYTRYDYGVGARWRLNHHLTLTTLATRVEVKNVFDNSGWSAMAILDF